MIKILHSSCFNCLCIFRYPHLTLKYKDPTPNFDRRKVKGLVCKMFRAKDPKFAQALECAAGGKVLLSLEFITNSLHINLVDLIIVCMFQLYFVITDTEETSKLLLQRGQLQQRCTIIPINRISGRSLDDKTVRLAQQVVWQLFFFSNMIVNPSRIKDFWKSVVWCLCLCNFSSNTNIQNDHLLVFLGWCRKSFCCNGFDRV